MLTGSQITSAKKLLLSLFSFNILMLAGCGSSGSTAATSAPPGPLPAVTTPVISPAGGTYTSTQAVTLADSTSGASIYYTTNGTTPTTASTLYNGPISVSSSETVEAIAVATGYSSSAVASAAYTISLPTAATPVISLPSGTYTSVQAVTISDSTSGASIYYTTNGTTPTASSTLYTGSINVGSAEVLSAIAVATGYSNSDVATVSYTLDLSTTTFTGTVMSGTKAVNGATMQLYQVGTSGYASTAAPLLFSAVTTSATGTFSLTGKYTCTSGTYLYATAAGGVVGSLTSSNPNLALGAAVGLCDNLSASTAIVIDEETTVALAYALAQFSSGTTFGATLVSQPGSNSSAPADNFATSGTNTAGIANAMAIAQLLANTATGTSPGSNGNGSAMPEWWQINLIADMLAACGNSTGGVAGDGSNCGTLFGNVTAQKGIAPVDTIQAALDLALTPTLPSANIATLYNTLVLPASAPFQPYPSTASAVGDFSVAIQYQPVASSTTLLKQPSAVALDTLGNAWVANQPTGGTLPDQGFLVELTPTGVPIQAGATAGVSPSNYVINTYSLNGTSTAMGGQYANHNGSYTITGLFAPSIDTNNNVWINDRENNAMAKITGSGTTYSSSFSYLNGGNALDSSGKGAVGASLPPNSGPEQTYVDGANNVWFQMTGVANPLSPSGNAQCGTNSLSMTGTINEGIGVFVGGDTSDAKAGSLGNAVNAVTPTPYIVVDPNVGDYTTVSGTTTPIPGAPFVWSLGNAGNATGLTVNYTSGSATAGCETAIGNITVGTVSRDAKTEVPVIGLPNAAVPGDMVQFMASGEDMAFDRFGSLWIANTGQIDTQTSVPADEILSSISKITPNYGSSFSPQ